MAAREKEYNQELRRDLKLLVVFGRCVQSIESRLLPHIASAGFTPAQFMVMEMLYHKGRLTVNEIIEKALSSSGNVGVVLANLVRLGWVKKTVDPTDRRVRYVELTDEGRETIRAYLPKHFAEVQDMFACLGRSEKDALIEATKKLGLSVRAKETS